MHISVYFKKNSLENIVNNIIKKYLQNSCKIIDFFIISHFYIITKIFKFNQS